MGKETLTLLHIPAWAFGKVASDLGLGGGFRRVLRFPPLLTNSHKLAIIDINVTKNKIPKKKHKKKSASLDIYSYLWSEVRTGEMLPLRCKMRLSSCHGPIDVAALQSHFISSCALQSGTGSVSTVASSLTNRTAKNKRALCKSLDPMNLN